MKAVACSDKECVVALSAWVGWMIGDWWEVPITRLLTVRRVMG